MIFVSRMHMHTVWHYCIWQMVVYVVVANSPSHIPEQTRPSPSYNRRPFCYITNEFPNHTGHVTHVYDYVEVHVCNTYIYIYTHVCHPKYETENQALYLLHWCLNQITKPPFSFQHLGKKFYWNFFGSISGQKTNLFFSSIDLWKKKSLI